MVFAFKRSRRWLTATVALGALESCALFDQLPRSAKPFSPPAVYARWWSEVEQCSGASGDLSGVSWYEAPINDIHPDGRPAGGYWNSYDNRIVIASEYRLRGILVRHEMLHALVRGSGHPREQFLGNCAGLVVCTDRCVTDAGAWHAPAGLSFVPVDSVRIDDSGVLLTRDASGQRWFELRIRVTNPATTPVFVESVAMATAVADLRQKSGGIELGSANYDSSSLTFAPDATREWLFDFLVSDSLTTWTVTPGKLMYRGLFAGRSTAIDSLTIPME